MEKSEIKNKRIGVLMGGLSREREISLRSGRAVAAALKSRGYAVAEIDVGRDVAAKLAQEKIELAVILLHGRWGEDGTLQGMLEVMGIPYSGSSPLASAMAMNKDLTKRVVVQAGIKTPLWKAVRSEERASCSESPFPLPVIVKPNREGSTLGCSIVRRSSEWHPALQQAAEHDDLILVEEYIEGTEVTVGLIDGKALPVLEIVPKSGFYDYHSKYTQGVTEYIVPARIPEPSRQEVAKLGERIFALLGMAGVARADFMWRESPYFLEINSVPGMTETSLVPKAAQAAGISFAELCERMVKGASLKV